MIPTLGHRHIGWNVHGGHRVIALVATAALVSLWLLAGRGGEAVCASTPANRPDLQVTALPGVDLRPLLGLPGLAASSGPFPAAATSVRADAREISVWLEGRPQVRSRAIVLDGDLARRLGALPGRHVTLATASGPARLEVAGVTSTAQRTPFTDGVAYTSLRELRRIAPNPHVWGSTLALQLADGSRTAEFAQWLERRYPARQVYVTLGGGNDCGRT
jgi:hypothetical protein